MKDEWVDVDRGLLRRRAVEIARPIEREASALAYVPLLEFSILGTRYAVLLDKVEAVARIGEIVSVPLAPRHISGIIRRRGQSIALVSLRHFFKADLEGIADADFAVIVSAGGKRFALQVEEIQGVTHLLEGRLSPPPENFDAAQQPYVQGVTEDDLIVLNLERLVRAKGFGTEQRE